MSASSSDPMRWVRRLPRKSHQRSQATRYAPQTRLSASFKASKPPVSDVDTDMRSPLVLVPRLWHYPARTPTFLDPIPVLSRVLNGAGSLSTACVMGVQSDASCI